MTYYKHQFDPRRLTSVILQGGRALMIDPLLEAERLAHIKPFLASHGITFFPPEEEFHIHGSEGNCFQMALLLANQRKLIYVEGIMGGVDLMGEEHWMVHAWCSTPQGVVIDPTRARVGGAGYTYIGVPIRRSIATTWAALRGWYGMIDGDPVQGPVLPKMQPELYRDYTLQLTA